MSITITAQTLIQNALRELNVIDGVTPPNANDAEWGLFLLNELIDSWITQQLTTLVQEQHEYALVAGQGGPSNPYTIGPGGDFDTGTASRPDLIRTANLSLNNSSLAVQIPLAIITDDMQAAIQIKELETQLANYLYYRRTVPLGEIQLWPVPNTSVNTLVLFTDLLTPSFATLNTTYVAPPGYVRALRLNLAKAYISSGGIPDAIALRVERNADDALMWLKDANANAKMGDLLLDPALTYNQNRWGTYNILSDQGS